MIEKLIQENYKLPLNLTSSLKIIKKNDLGIAINFEQELNQEKKKTTQQIQESKKSIIDNLIKEKSKILFDLNDQIKEFERHKNILLEKIESSSKDILLDLLKNFHLDISYKEKLNYSLSKLISRYRDEKNIYLVVQSTQDLKKLEVDIPVEWKITEDPSINSTCKLVLESSVAECNFDALFKEITYMLDQT